MELLSAKWCDVDLSTQEWLIHVSKQDKDESYEVINPIPDAVLCVFQHLKIFSNGSDYLFPNRKVGTKNGFVCDNTLNCAVNQMFGTKKTKTRKAMPNLFEPHNIKHFVVHDLRRSCKTLLTTNGVSDFISERCINHRLKGIEGVYNRYDYFSERKAAFTLIANLVMPLASINKLDF
jgi:integrase